jgi:beta-galactosidase
VTTNNFGSGTLTYEGTVVSDKLQQAIVLEALRGAGLAVPGQQLPSSVRVKNGVSQGGQKLHYYLNYSSSPAAVVYSYPAGTDLLTGQSLAQGQQTTIAPWDLIIVKEKSQNR